MSGIGRGRGWLNINKNANTKPGMQSPVENVLNYDFNSTVAPSVSPPKTNPTFTNIISKISLYNENDDGILLNQKLKHFIEEFNKDCQNADDVEEAFASIYEQCLTDEEFVGKVIGVASAPSFNNVHIHGVKLRSLFVTQLQKDFEGSKQIQASNPKAFRNIVKMLGDFYHKARLLNGQQYKFLAAPMVKYLDMLLESNCEADFQMFTVQLYMNGNGIKEQQPSKLSDLLIQVRNLLAYNDKLTSICKLWLMLSIDISGCRYNILPVEIHQFYLTHLGDEAMSRIKKLSTKLSIQTNYKNTTLDSIQSNVNVLQQVSDGWDSSSSTSDADKPPEGYMPLPKKKPFKAPDEGMSNIGTWEQPKNEKTPRPILGAGVRLKQEIYVDEWGKSDEWKENSSWENNKKNGRLPGWSTADVPKNNTAKGWEHDDRFENDYN